MNNGNYSSGEDNNDSRGGPNDQICCLVEMGIPGMNGERCKNQAGNASYSKRIQKTVLQRRLKLNIDTTVNIIVHLLLQKKKIIKSLVMFFFFVFI